MAQKVLAALAAKFGDAIEHTESQHGDEIAVVARDRLVEVVTWLKDDPAMAFDAPVFVTCIDLFDLRRPDANGRLVEVLREPQDGRAADVPRFEVCYQLRSSQHRHRIRLKVRVPENDPRVPRTESEQMVARVQKNGTPVWYLMAADEGHGFAKRDNVDYYQWAALLRSLSGYEAFRRRFPSLRPLDVADFVVLDGDFPRSLRFAVDRMAQALARVGSARADSPSARAVSELSELLAKSDGSALFEAGLHEFLQRFLAGISDLHGALQREYFEAHLGDAACAT